jgi:hypothetical protein
MSQEKFCQVWGFFCINWGGGGLFLRAILIYPSESKKLCFFNIKDKNANEDYRICTFKYTESIKKW